MMEWLEEAARISRLDAIKNICVDNLGDYANVCSTYVPIYLHGYKEIMEVVDDLLELDREVSDET